jgi:ABC-type multidrug transport system fused ATPase/permease subunit
MNRLNPLYWRLLALARPYVFPFIVLMATAMLLLAATEGIVVVLIKHLGDQVTMKHDFRSVELISAGILAMFAVRAVAEFGAYFLEAYITQKITRICARNSTVRCRTSRSRSSIRRRPV